MLRFQRKAPILFKLLVLLTLAFIAGFLVLSMYISWTLFSFSNFSYKLFTFLSSFSSSDLRWVSYLFCFKSSVRVLRNIFRITEDVSKLLLLEEWYSGNTLPWNFSKGPFNNYVIIRGGGGIGKMMTQWWRFQVLYTLMMMTV